MICQKDGPDLATLIHLAEKKAGAADGHLSLFRFTTEWKVMIGTADLDAGGGRDQVRELTGYESLEDALINLILSPSDCINYDQ